MSTSLTSLRFNTQAQTDIQRMSRELADLQRQVSSGYKASDLAGFGPGAGRFISTRAMAEASQARADSAQKLEARFGVQAAALNQAASGAEQLSVALKNAVANDDVESLETELTASFSVIVTALNETWDGKALFAGERVDARPIGIGTLDELAAVSSVATIFRESDRPQIVDFGAGAQYELADRASDVSTDLFEVMRELKLMLNAWGNNRPDQLAPGEQQTLLALADRLDVSRGALSTAEGRSGHLQEQVTAERTRQSERATLLSKELSEQADADIAAISVQLNVLLAQYQATAKTFADISQLTVLNFLR